MNAVKVNKKLSRNEDGIQKLNLYSFFVITILAMLKLII